MAIFVKQRKDLSAFGWLSIIDANSRQVITEHRKTAQLFGWHWDHVGKDSTILYPPSPFATCIGYVTPYPLFFDANAESPTFSCCDNFRVLVELRSPDVQSRN